MMLNGRVSAFLFSLLLLSPLASATQSFPFTIKRSTDGRIQRIEITNSSAFSEEGPDLLAELRKAHADFAAAAFAGQAEEFSGTELANDDERKAFEDAKLFLVHGLSKRDLEDPRLDEEFANARRKLDGLEVYRLLASPHEVGAFDRENATKQAIESVLDAAKLIFDLSPAFKVFEFLVDQHLENLESRREFHQTRLLVLLDHSPQFFTDEERAAIRSSIHYSRIPILSSKERESARRIWTTFGDAKSIA
ncbi:MAG: hypothetical protein AAB250_12280, partial [Bdellovibrionota bacterium]